MQMTEMFLADIERELPGSRRVLERVPEGKFDWKPHPKSFSLAHLAQLVARMPGWVTHTMKQDSLDLSSAPKYSNEKTEALLAEFDRCVKEAKDALAKAKDDDFGVPWSLTMGDRVLMTMPRLTVMRQNINHLAHHRGQLTVYLRLLDVPIPSIYGPTADEPW